MKSKRNHKETLNKTPEFAWVFDVDGVVTDPVEKRITKPVILDFIVKKLKQKEPVAFLTGRAMSWMEERVLTPLEEEIKDKSLLDNLYVSAEFGGSLIVYNKGERQRLENSEITPPQNVVEIATKIASRYANSMFIDTAKKTHFTLEMNDGVDFDRFKEDQIRLDAEFEQLLKDCLLTNQFEILSDRIATSIRDKRINKRFAIKELLKWISKRGIKPNKYIVFGDNKADLEMGEELADSGLEQDFVFVGEKDQIELGKYSFPIIITNHQCDTGTAEYLANY